MLDLPFDRVNRSTTARALVELPPETRLRGDDGNGPDVHYCEVTASAPERWYRGLPYRRDRPLDRREGRGWLARDVTLAGVVLEAGSEVWRDVDSDVVWARLAAPARLGTLELPAGTVVELLAAPWSLGRMLHVGAWVAPIVVGWTLVVGTAELVQGRLSAGRGRRKRAPLSFVAWPAGEVYREGSRLDCGPGDRILHRRDGSIEIARA